MDDPRCDFCHRRLGPLSVWLFHNGGPLCGRCIADELYDEAVLLYQRGELPRCQGLCGRLVYDLRERGQSVSACSSGCRRRFFNDIRRMERRARLRTLPPVRCVECGADLRPARSDVRYCSALCRVRAHRHRKRAALATRHLTTR
jgi:hypothetical protein